LLSAAVARVKETDVQSLLAARDRNTNLEGAFAIKHDQLPQSVAIIDDVMTTGSTLNSLAGELKQRGVTFVDAWVIARANS
jgi:predicted amidophosphoribosyltransferase